MHREAHTLTHWDTCVLGKFPHHRVIDGRNGGKQIQQVNAPVVKMQRSHITLLRCLTIHEPGASQSTSQEIKIHPQPYCTMLHKPVPFVSKGTA